MKVLALDRHKDKLAGLEVVEQNVGRDIRNTTEYSLKR